MKNTIRMHRMHPMHLYQVHRGEINIFPALRSGFLKVHPCASLRFWLFTFKKPVVFSYLDVSNAHR